MTDNLNPTTDEIRRLQQAIAAQVGLRGIMPDEQIDAQLASLQEQLVKLQQAAADRGSAVSQEGGTAVAERGVNVSGKAGIVASGDRNTIIVIADEAAAAFWQDFAGNAHGADVDLQAATSRYLTFLIERYRYLDFRGMGIADRVPLRLPLLDMYVPLKARAEMPDGETWARDLMVAGRRVSPEEAEDMGQRLSKPVAVLDLIRDNDGLIILGDPGAGKTTFLKYLTLQLALGEGEALGLANRLPVLLPLSAYANTLANGDIPLDRFLGEYYAGLGIDLPIMSLLKEALERGGALLLLDGLDEVRDTTQRSLVLERVMTFCGFQRPQGNKFVLTSRIVGYKEIRATAEGMAECTLVDFDQKEIELFVERWTSAIENAALGQSLAAVEEAGRERQELLDAVRRNPGVRRLAANPLLLTILALMKRQGVTLPDRRVELYEQYIKTLIKHWNVGRGLDRRSAREIDPVETVRILAPLALWMHETSPGVGLVKQEAMRRRLAAIYAERSHPQPEQAARQLLRDARDHAGLLVERGRGVFGFIHLTFQEYLAAVAIGQLGQSDLQPAVDAIAAHVDDDNWHEVVLLAVSYFGIVQQRDEAASEVLRRLISGAPGEPGQAILLAGAAAVDAWPGGITETGREEIVATLLATMRDTEVSAVRRAGCGHALARLGDPRLEVMQVDAMPFCLVPAGPFCMGSLDGDPDARDNEKPLHEVDIAYDYWIGRYPVTNAQYRVFVDDGGYAESSLWPEAEAADFWRDGRFKGRGGPYEFGEPYNLSNHPIIGVSWYEALAFTRWLTARWRKAGLLPKNLVVALPSEAEWEKAARGGKKIPRESQLTRPGLWRTELPVIDNPLPKRRFPWGNAWESDRSNSADSGIDATSAVGVFPGPITGYGASDLSGNVYEWTRSFGRAYPYVSHDGRERVTRVQPESAVVLRGGAYTSRAGMLRCAVRFRYLPYDWYFNRGFRVVVSPFLTADL